MKKAILTCLLVFCLVLQGCANNADNSLGENTGQITKSTTTTLEKRETVPVSGGNESGDFLFTYSFDKNAYKPGETIKGRVTVKNNTGHIIEYFGESTCPRVSLLLNTPTKYTHIYERDIAYEDGVSRDMIMSKDYEDAYEFRIVIQDHAHTGYYDVIAEIDYIDCKVVFEDVIEIYK